VLAPDGAFTGYLGSGVDFTDRRNAESAIRASEARIRGLVEAAVDGIVTMDEFGTVQSINSATTRMFGYAASEVVGKNIKMLMPSPFRNEHDNYLRTYRETGNRHIVGSSREVMGLRRNGQAFPLYLAVSEVRIADSRVFTGILRDITVQKETEGALRKSNAELAEFAHSISHDLKAPLRAIQGFSEALEEDYGDQIGDEGRSYLNHITGGVTRMENLINDLLRLARLGSSGLEFARVSLDEIAQRVVRNLKSEIDRVDAEISVQPDLPSIHGHAGLIEAMIQNLTANALKFVHAERRPRIEIGARIEPGGVCVFIRDNGIGIPAKHHERIFNIFQRLHLQSEYPGTGIGLAIVRKAATLHHAEVRLDSQPDVGTTFEIVFPSDAVVANEKSTPSADRPNDAVTTP
jgi:PAS domain S-box-containing protein